MKNRTHATLVLFTALTLALFALACSGCASARPQSRVIDATNSAPMFQRSVTKDAHKDKVSDNGVLLKHKEKTTTYDFTF